jgi:replicative DNA helicase
MSTPNNPTAERDVLGSMLLSADALRTGIELIRAEDFYDIFHANTFMAIQDIHARGAAVDIHIVVAELQQRGGDLGEDRVRLLDIITNVPAPGNVADYIAVVARNAAARRVLALCAETSNAVVALDDPYEAADGLQTALGTLDAPVDKNRTEAVTADDLLATAEVESPWVVPGMIRQDWRVLLVAGEGVGKSVILRQIAMLAAQGVHPFTFKDIQPIRALIVDLENPAASIAETASRMVYQLRTRLGDNYDSERCKFFRRPQGLDPRTRQGRGELEREIANHRPNLVCIGPAYKMLHRKSGKGGTESYEEATDPVLSILDDLRTRYKFGLMIEHHAPQGFGGQRDMRPYGSQRWLAWPEIGLSLKADKEERNTWNLGRHRGDRMTTDWPTQLHHDTVWPWVGSWVNGMANMSSEQGEPF